MGPLAVNAAQRAGGAGAGTAAGGLEGAALGREGAGAGARFGAGGAVLGVGTGAGGNAAAVEVGVGAELGVTRPSFAALSLSSLSRLAFSRSSRSFS